MADQEPTKRKGNPNWVKGGKSPNPSGKARVDSTEQTPARVEASAWAVAPARMGAWMETMRNDGWKNALTGMGMRGRDKSTHTHFEVEPVTGEEALEIWRGDPLGARIVEIPPREMLRQGYELQIGENEAPERYQPPEPEAPSRPPPAPAITASPQARSALAAAKADAQARYLRRHPSAFDRRVRAAITRSRIDAGDAKPLQASITKLFEKLHVNSALEEALRYKRAYGGGAVLIGANDYTTDLREPLDLKRVRSLDWLTPLEARELQPLYWYNNPRAPKFGRPAIYQLIPYVVGAPVDGGAVPVTITQIHESRLIIFDGARVSRRITSTATWGWGDSVFTRIKKALQAFNTGHQNAETLLADFAQAVYKIKNLAEVLAQEGSGGGSLADRLMAVDMARSIIRAIAIDADEEFSRESTSLAGYSDVLDRLSLWLSAVSGFPSTLLMGRSPAGMNATGDSDIRLFYDQMASGQVLEVGPALLYLTRIGLASMGEDPDTVPHSVKFNALWQPTAKEIADAHFTQAQADAIYIDREVVSPEEIALSRWGSDKYSPDTHLDFEARAAQEAVVAPVVDAKPKQPPPVMPLPAGGADPSGLAPSGAAGDIPDDAKTPQDDPDEPDRMDAKAAEALFDVGRAHLRAANRALAEGRVDDAAKAVELARAVRADGWRLGRLDKWFDAKLASATIAVRRARADYSPDQERDESGRFGAGGSSPGHAARASSKAAAASAHAHGSGKAEDHAKAAGAHKAAAGAHEKAGNHHAAASHEHAAKHHEHEAHSLLEVAKLGGSIVAGGEAEHELGIQNEGGE